MVLITRGIYTIQLIASTNKVMDYRLIHSARRAIAITAGFNRSSWIGVRDHS